MSNTNDGHYWGVLQPIWPGQETSGDPDAFLSWFAQLSDLQRLLFPTHWLQSEVRNGGFHQYFSNPTGMHAPEAIHGFRELKLLDISLIVEKCVAVFGSVYPRQQAVRLNFLNSISGTNRSDWDPFYDLDRQFYNALRIPGAEEFSVDNRFTIAADALLAKRR